MTTERLYKKAERADDMADLDLKDADPKELAKAIYEQWIGSISRHSYYPPNQKDIDANYNLGLAMVRPYREKFKGVLRPREWYDNGEFLSILLNGTDLERLVLDFDDYPDSAGYRLGTGKTLEINGNKEKAIAERHSVAAFGQGGTLINNGYIMFAGWHSDLDFSNYGKCYSAANNATGGKWVNYNHISGPFAEEAKDGLFINRGTARSFGMEAEGGVGINLGKVTQSIAGKAKGGLWLNFGEGQSMGSNAGGGIFISTVRVGKSWIKNHHSFANGAYKDAIAIRPAELKTDPELFDLVEAVEQAAREEKYEEVKQLARKVDAHVRVNYRGRKVA